MRSKNPKLMESQKSVPMVNKRFSDLRVLLVEDNPNNAFLGMEILNKLGCQTKIAERADHGLRLLSKEEFDLLLIDIQMPEMNGVEMLKLIRSKEGVPDNLKQHQTAIALTAHALEFDKEMYLKEGFDEYISKPIDIETLTQEMNRVLKTDGNS